MLRWEIEDKDEPSASSAENQIPIFYCLNNATLVINAWWELGNQLLVRYNHLWIYDAKTRKLNPLPFPDWYLKALVEYNKLKPQPEKR